MTCALDVVLHDGVRPCSSGSDRAVRGPVAGWPRRTSVGSDRRRAHLAGATDVGLRRRPPRRRHGAPDRAAPDPADRARPAVPRAPAVLLTVAAAVPAVDDAAVGRASVGGGDAERVRAGHRDRRVRDRRRPSRGRAARRARDNRRADSRADRATRAPALRARRGAVRRVPGDHASAQEPPAAARGDGAALDRPDVAARAARRRRRGRRRGRAGDHRPRSRRSRGQTRPGARTPTATR